MSEEAVAKEKRAVAVIDGLKKNPTVSEFLLFTHILAKHMALGDNNIVSRMLDYAHSVRRNNADNPESRIRVLADVIAGMLESYFATLEPIQRLERLSVVVGANTLWLQILNALDRSGEWRQADIIGQVTELVSKEGAKQRLYLALEDLRVRELVDCLYSDPDPEKMVYSLSRLGDEVRTKLAKK